MFHSSHARHTLCEQEPSSYSNRIRTQTQSFHHLSSSRYPAVYINLEWPTFVAFRISGSQAGWVDKSGGLESGRAAKLGSEELRCIFPDFEEDIERWSGRVQLTTAVIRDEDASSALLIC